MPLASLAHNVLLVTPRFSLVWSLAALRSIPSGFRIPKQELILTLLAMLLYYTKQSKPSRHEMSLRDLNQISIERDMSETSQKHLKRDDFFEMSLRCLKYIPKKMSFL